MSNLFKKFSVPVADRQQQKRSIESDTLVTQSFFHVTPVYHKNCYEGDKLKLNGSMFSRMVPLVTPAFVTADNFIRAFYVPYRLVQPDFDDFITNTRHITPDGRAGNIDRCRCTFESTLCAAFLSVSDFYTTASRDDYDLVLNGGTFIYLTPLGSYVYKVLISLGYDLKSVEDVGDLPPEMDTRISLLPLMCYCRVFCDWVFPKNYWDDAFFVELRKRLYRDSLDNEMDVDDIRQMLLCVEYAFYTNDTFNLCWDNPLSPNNDNNGIRLTINDFTYPESDSHVTDETSSTTPALFTNRGSFTKFGLKALDSLSDFCKRNNLAGSRAIDRFLARHGYLTESQRLDRSIYLGEKRFPIGVDAVASTNQSSDVNLGDLAGRGISTSGSDAFTFECQCAERGMFIVLAFCTPQASLVQGYDKDVLCTAPLDFYQPEFAQLGVDAVRAIEVFIPDYSMGHPDARERIFGYLPRWYQYNMVKSVLAGDYRVHSRGALQLSAEHTFRLFTNSSFGNSGENIVHSLDFMKARDQSQYYRLAYFGNNVSDLLHMFFRWNLEYISSIPPAKDSFNWDALEEHTVNKSVETDVANRF